MPKKNDDLNERIADAIRAQLINLMSEDELRTRVDTEMEAFFKPRHYGRGEYTHPSCFAEMVNLQIKERTKPILEELFRSDKWKMSLNEQGDVVLGTFFTEVLKFDSTMMTDIAAQHVYRNLARSILLIIQDGMNNSGNWEIANAIQARINAAFDNL